MKTDAGPIAVEKWQDVLAKSPSIEERLWNRVVVLQQTDSTQDAARRLDAQVGDVLVAGRQTSGRGRLGRAWADTGEDGVAVTFVLEAIRSERLAVACAVAAAHAIGASMKVNGGWRTRKVKIGIKWPNDIVVDGRKIAGILIEQTDERAYVGIGINVRQVSWPAELQRRAISLAELGFDVDRLLVIEMLMQCLRFMLRDDDARLIDRFRERDALTGTTCCFRIGEREVRGTVVRVDPMRGLAVLTENQGEVWLPAATTTLIKD
jgi:BirA family transcriptional regulator, biotin operon repressor / biotin---[acetyl-CoA-carboxylase] ligase